MNMRMAATHRFLSGLVFAAAAILGPGFPIAARAVDMCRMIA